MNQSIVWWRGLNGDKTYDHKVTRRSLRGRGGEAGGAPPLPPTIPPNTLTSVRRFSGKPALQL